MVNLVKWNKWLQPILKYLLWSCLKEPQETKLGKLLLISIRIISPEQEVELVFITLQSSVN